MFVHLSFIYFARSSVARFGVHHVLPESPDDYHENDYLEHSDNVAGNE